LLDKNEALSLELERLNVNVKETSVSDISIQTETFDLRATISTSITPNITEIREPIQPSNIQSLQLIQPQIHFIPKIMTIYRSYSQYLRYHIVLVGLKALKNDTLLLFSGKWFIMLMR
jgi:hypothetical protein